MVNPSVRAWGYKLLSAKTKNFDKTVLQVQFNHSAGRTAQQKRALA